MAIAGLRKLAGAPKEEVAQLINKAIKANPTEVAPRLVLIDQYIKRQDLKAALTAAQTSLPSLPTATISSVRVSLTFPLLPDTGSKSAFDSSAIRSTGRLILRRLVGSFRIFGLLPMISARLPPWALGPPPSMSEAALTGPISTASQAFSPLRWERRPVPIAPLNALPKT